MKNRNKKKQMKNRGKVEKKKTEGTEGHFHGWEKYKGTSV
jgi:hypothetical protein